MNLLCRRCRRRGVLPTKRRTKLGASLLAVSRTVEAHVDNKLHTTLDVTGGNLHGGDTLMSPGLQALAWQPRGTKCFDTVAEGCPPKASKILAHTPSATVNGGNRLGRAALLARLPPSLFSGYRVELKPFSGGGGVSCRFEPSNTRL